MNMVGIIGGLGPESTIDYYRRILEAWERHDPSSAPAIVIDSLDVRRALRLVEHDRTRSWIPARVAPPLAVPGLSRDHGNKPQKSSTARAAPVPW